MKILPRTQVFFPASPIEFLELFKQTYKSNLIKYHRLPENQHDEIFTAEMIKVGKGIKVCNGRDVTIIVIGSQLTKAKRTAFELSKENINCELLYFHTIKPFDSELTYASLNKTRKVLVIEEHSMYAGIGDEVIRVGKNIDGMKYEFTNLGNQYIHEYDTYDGLCEKLGYNIKNMILKIYKLIK